MTMQRPTQALGMRHIALNVINLEDCVQFYRDLLGLELEWQPDADNYYLTTGHDNVALHRAAEGIQEFGDAKQQRLDHLGFMFNDPSEIDAWHDFLQANSADIKCKPKQHRDGAYSFYCADPDGNIVQMIYHPPIANK